LLAIAAPAQSQTLAEKDTLASAKLSATERRQIISAVEQLAFDTPESWGKELRVRRVELGSSPGIIVQGTDLLCGGTGNCQLFIFRRVNDKWVSLFGDDQAPMADGFELGPGITHGIKDLTVTTTSSAKSTQRVIYRFDGRHYRAHPTPLRGHHLQRAIS
jgi:hypothetical protein